VLTTLLWLVERAAMKKLTTFGLLDYELQGARNGFLADYKNSISRSPFCNVRQI